MGGLTFADGAERELGIIRIRTREAGIYHVLPHIPSTASADGQQYHTLPTLVITQSTGATTVGSDEKTAAVTGCSLKRSPGVANTRGLARGRLLAHLVRVYGQEWKLGQKAPNRLHAPPIERSRYATAENSYDVGDSRTLFEECAC